ncbi:serine hydroxymethyltransferase [Candidatus Riesia pediculischaeffi]|uniref:Serine hydroxymethyltransferase n=2 Tax=Candidatus Riesia pediculischaeffi TaxID=428411 RepID=A0A1V0HLE0_9ENTR|nr:serine hydroxymethyltransferase [Candidatus Riesia pediculischaeffi]ARC53521.1 serine hydroxymethyltransferase [Candidatus Riesia pediculischaeffi]
MKEMIRKYDRKVWNILRKEFDRQEGQIELIASENYASYPVMEAQGSCLTNKYAEGYPRDRYYGGCQYVDLIEELAIERAKKLFKVDFANVQPHSGSQANLAIYMSVLDAGDTILSMRLKDGGHLTHGSPSNFSGKFYNFVHYSTLEDGTINYEEISRKADMYRPKMIIAGFSSYSRTVDWEKMRNIADEFDSYLLADIAHVAGLVAAGIHTNPASYAHFMTATTHKTLGGPRGGLILANGGDEKLYRRINSSVFPGSQGGPLMHVIAGKAIAFKEAMESRFRDYQIQVLKNAKSMVRVFLDNGYRIVSGGTENHLFVLDLQDKCISGKVAELQLGLSDIIVNKNYVPNDPRGPKDTSGIRIGTSAVTRRGFKEEQSKIVSSWICDILDNVQNDKLIREVKNMVLKMTRKFPVYPHRYRDRSEIK